MRLLTLAIAFLSLINPCHSECSGCVIMQNLIQENFASLQHLDKEHSRRMVVFSSAEGLPRHELACFLEEGLEAVRIDVDRIAYSLMSAGIDPSDHNSASGISPLEAFLFTTLKILAQESENHLIILDCDIDGYFAHFAQHAQNFAYPVTVVRLEGELNGESAAYENFPLELVSFVADETNFGEILDGIAELN